MLENGDPANFVFAFFRPHVTSVLVLNTHSQPQIANPRIIATNQIALNIVMHTRRDPPIIHLCQRSVNKTTVEIVLVLYQKHSPSVVSEATAEEKIGSLIRICGGRF